MNWFEALCKAFAFLVTFVIYAGVLFCFALDAAGAGHGTFILFAPLITSVLLVPAGVMVVVGRNWFRSRHFLVVMLIHYAVTAFLVVPYFVGEVSAGFLKMWTHYEELFYRAIIWYAAGQALMWLGYGLRVKHSHSNRDGSIT